MHNSQYLTSYTVFGKPFAAVTAPQPAPQSLPSTVILSYLQRFLRFCFLSYLPYVCLCLCDCRRIYRVVPKIQLQQNETHSSCSQDKSLFSAATGTKVAIGVAAATKVQCTVTFLRFSVFVQLFVFLYFLHQLSW